VQLSFDWFARYMSVYEATFFYETLCQMHGQVDTEENTIKYKHMLIIDYYVLKVTMLNYSMS